MTNTGFGLRLVAHLFGDPQLSHISRCYVPSSDGTAMYRGDMVQSTSGGAGLVSGQPTLKIATAVTGTFTGTMGGVCITPDIKGGTTNTVIPDVMTLYRKASTEQYVLICDDPYAIFEAVSDGTGALNKVGDNASFINGTGVNATGISNGMISQSSAATTSTLPLRLFEFSQIVGSTPTGVAAVYRVMPNAHEYKAGTTGTGT